MNFFEKTFNFKTYKTKYNDLVAQNKEVLKRYEDLQKSKKAIESHYENSLKYMDELSKEIGEKNEKIKSLQETRVTLNRTINDFSDKIFGLEKELKSSIDSNNELLQKTELLFEDMMKTFAGDIASASKYFDNIVRGINNILGLFNGIDIVSKYGAVTKSAAEGSRDKIIGIGIKLSQYKIYFENKELRKINKNEESPDFFEKPENLDK